MADTPPLVSIKIASYNHARFIGQTIQSVLAQSYQNFELIIVDDCSGDNSIDVIRSFTDSRITLIANEQNIGASASSKKAKALCRGEYYCPLDSDDYFHPDKLAIQVAYLAAHPDIDLVASFVQEVDEQNNPITNPLAANWFNQDLDFNQPENWLWANHICHSSVLMKRSIHDQLWDYDSGLPYTNDWNNWIRFLAKGAVFSILSEKLTYYRFHAGNITHKNFVRSYWEYAYISAKVFHPFLMGIGRDDLVIKNLTTFFRHASCPIDRCERINLLRLFLNGASCVVPFEDLWLKRSDAIGDREMGSPSQMGYLIVESMFSWVREAEVMLQDRDVVIHEKEALIRKTVYPRLVRWLSRKLNNARSDRKS